MGTQSFILKMVVGNRSDGGQTQESDGRNTICTSSTEGNILRKISNSKGFGFVFDGEKNLNHKNLNQWEEITIFRNKKSNHTFNMKHLTLKAKKKYTFIRENLSGVASMLMSTFETHHITYFSNHISANL